MKLIARLEFELANYAFTVQYICHNALELAPKLFVLTLEAMTVYERLLFVENV